MKCLTVTWGRVEAKRNNLQLSANKVYTLYIYWKLYIDAVPLHSESKIGSLSTVDGIVDYNKIDPKQIPDQSDILHMDWKRI